MYDPNALPNYASATNTLPGYGSAKDAENAPGLQSVDFLPLMTAPDGPSDRPEYEPFHVVMERANVFLREHPDYVVSTCESIELRMVQKDNVWEIDTVSSVFTVYGASNTRWIRALRLWTQRGAFSANPQQIGYCNFIPQVQGGKVTETFDEVVARINRSPIYGKIITVETQPVKWGSQGSINPDRTIWTVSQNTNPRFFNLLRIFYIQGLTQHSRVCLADFVPKELPQETDDLYRRFETFPVVLDRVRRWLLSVPPNYRPLNVQSVLTRWESSDKPPMDPNYINTREVMFHDFAGRVQFLRYLRVAYIIENPVDGPASRSTVQLGSKLIVPLMIKAPESYNQEDKSEFETQESTRARLDRWVRSTGVRVVSAETVPMRIQDGGESVYGFGAMHTWKKSSTSGSVSINSDEKFLCSYRVYTDGNVADDSQEDNSRLLTYMLNSREKKQEKKSDDDCCIL